MRRRGGLLVQGADGASRLVRLSMLHRPSTRAALLHSVSAKGKEGADHDDDTLGLLDQVRSRFDTAGVPMQDVLVRGCWGGVEQGWCMAGQIITKS